MEEAKQLIIQAFKQAKDSGKPDWHRMTTAVLKNRLLALTDQQFNEATYGTSTLADFVGQFSDILNIDYAQSPIVVELKDPKTTGLGAPETSERIRIRGDLWRAVLDRSSGNTYYWLADLGVVGTSPTDGVCPILPTIDNETDRQLRQSFLESLSSAPDEAAEWAQSLLPLSHLPPGLRPQWNRVLIERIHQRLLDWFKDKGLEPPPDFITVIQPKQMKPPRNLESLRSVVQRVVAHMTEEELSQLSLPPRAVLKATDLRNR